MISFVFFYISSRCQWHDACHRLTVLDGIYVKWLLWHRCLQTLHGRACHRSPLKSRSHTYTRWSLALSLSFFTYFVFSGPIPFRCFSHPSHLMRARSLSLSLSLPMKVIKPFSFFSKYFRVEIAADSDSPAVIEQRYGWRYELQYFRPGNKATHTAIARWCWTFTTQWIGTVESRSVQRWWRCFVQWSKTIENGFKQNYRHNGIRWYRK